jgi:uncharacterized protein Yka (UPF0111/DUF47 family)
MAKKDSLWHDYDDYYVTPMMLLEALDDACDEMNYSNYHCDKFSRIKKLIRRYIKEHSIPIGPTKKAIEQKQLKKTERETNRLKRLVEKIKMTEESKQ